MEFTIRLYVTEGGRCPVREYLNRLRQEDNRHWSTVIEVLRKMRHRDNHRRPFSEHVRDGLFAVRASAARQTRVFFCFGEGGKIVLLHAFAKTTPELPSREIEVALQRMRDFQRRSGDG
jgi:phage-related protein